MLLVFGGHMGPVASALDSEGLESVPRAALGGNRTRDPTNLQAFSNAVFLKVWFGNCLCGLAQGPC